MCQLLKGPIGQVKVVDVTIAPQLLNLCPILDLERWTGVDDVHKNGVAVVVALHRLL